MKVTNTLVKVFDLTVPVEQSEAAINEFLQSGIKIMQDGITYYPERAIFMYRPQDMLGNTLHGQLNLVNNDIQNVQKKILQCLSKIDDLNIRIDMHNGSEDAKASIKAEIKKEENDLDFQKRSLVKLKSLYAAIESGTIDTLNM